MDNSGENIGNTIEELKQMGIEVELTAPHTPQHNGVVERNFFTDHCSSQAMLTSAHLTKKTADILWAEVVSTSEKLKNCRVNTHNRETSPYELFHGNTPKILKGLIQFGRVGYVTIRDKFKTKFSPKSKRCLMVGYAEDHQYNVYRMYNPTSRKIILSRDVVWGAWERMNSHSDKSVNTFEIKKLIEEKYKLKR